MPRLKSKRDRESFSGRHTLEAVIRCRDRGGLKKTPLPFLKGVRVMKTRRSILLTVAFLVSFPLIGAGDDQSTKKQADVKELMKQKLQHSQKILEAITTNDFDSLAKHADELILISKEAEFKVLKTPRYETYSNDFRRNAETLIESAKEKNLDAAALAYVDLTLNCVKCHKHVREVRMTRSDQTHDNVGLSFASK
jgi:hypothetical protein